MDPIKEALSFAYAHSMTNYNGNLWTTKETRKKHNRSGAKKHTRALYQAHVANQTRTTRINTTALCANGMRAGRLIAAADDQPMIRRLWLEYVYNPVLDVYPIKKHNFELELVPLIFGLWCFYPNKTKVPHPALIDAAGVFLYLVFQDAVQYARSGTNSRKTSNTYKAEQMGYGRGRDAYQASDYSRTWRPIENDIRAMLNELDERALVGIRALYPKQ